MWRTLLLGLGNLLFSWFGTYVVRLPGFDLTPIGIILIARGGEGIIVGALVLAASYCIVKPERFRWVWLQVPAALLTGYLALVIESAFLLVVVYHGALLTTSVALGLFSKDSNHLFYVAMNAGINLLAARFLA